MFILCSLPMCNTQHISLGPDSAVHVVASAAMYEVVRNAAAVITPLIVTTLP